MLNTLRIPSFLTLLSAGIFFFHTTAQAQPAGSLDLSFDPGLGMAHPSFTVPKMVVVQPDGSILIGGQFHTYNGTPRNALARIMPDGSLDASFNVQLDAGYRLVNAAAVQPDGKILIAGTFNTVNGTPFGNIARLLPNGTVDPAFLPGSGTPGFQMIEDMVLQPDGKILIGGNFTSVSGTPRKGLARLNADGSLDTGFTPGSGIMHSAQNAFVSSLALQPDGKILIGGDFESYNGFASFNIVRVLSNGTYDASFSTGDGFNAPVSTMTLQPDGNLLVGGAFTEYDNDSHSRIIRLLPDGSVDPLFLTGIGTNYPVSSITVQPDGQLLLAGTSGTGNPGVYVIALQPDGKLLIAGSFSSYNGTTRHNMARLGTGLVTGLPGTLTTNLHLYPNPASEAVKLELPFGEAASAKAEIYNTLGQLVYSGMLPGSAEINTRALPSGTYLVRVTQAGKVISSPLVIER
jgi:uncharacterized delta-60 repeat protein